LSTFIRDVAALSDRDYDLIIIGGGIFGVCSAWEAVLRGLSVALIEKGDFCSTTSANHFKMVHGGIRYLQHGDFYRIRESSRERSALLRIAPHLVKPLPILIPTYGHGLKGRAFLASGLLVYDALTMGRNKGLQPERKIPLSRFLSRQEVLGLFPGVKKKNLTGGAVFCDGQIYNPPRLGLSFLRSAANEGAVAANYVLAEKLIQKGTNQRVVGVKAKDTISGDHFDIRGKIVLNASGPWANHFIEANLNSSIKHRPIFSRDLAFVVKRENSHEHALAFTTSTIDSDTILDRGGRHLFAVPWRNYTLIGVWHKVFEGLPESIDVMESELEGFVKEAKEGFPGLEINTSDISMINTGLTLFGDEDKQGKRNMSFGKRSQLIDHHRESGIDGLVTLIGVRATTARGMAQKAVDLVLSKLGNRPLQSQTEFRPIFGGDIESFNDLLLDAKKDRLKEFDDDISNALICNYGSRYHDVLQYLKSNDSMGERIGGSAVLRAEIFHAIQNEMALKLSDVVFRRTDLATGENPGDSALSVCAEIMAMEMGWSQQRLKEEIEEVKKTFPHYFK
jgi:glycerol-3-phosphate dehydrogenase